MAKLLMLGETAEIARRHFKRPVGVKDANGEVAKREEEIDSPILRAYVRTKHTLEFVEATAERVVVKAIAEGHARVDVIDQESEPYGTDYDFEVLRPAAEGASP